MNLNQKQETLSIRHLSKTFKMEKETRIPCNHCAGTGGEFGNECHKCRGLGYRKGYLSTISNTFFMVIILILFLLFTFSAFGQAPVMYGGSYQPAYYDFNYEGQYTLNEEWVVVEQDTFVGYWSDSLFVSKNRMFMFKSDRVEKLSKCVPMNTLFKGCSVGDLPYWSVIAEYFNGEKYYHLVGFSAIGEEPAYKMLIQNPVHNTFTGQVRVEQNGRIFYLFNPIRNSEQ